MRISEQWLREWVSPPLLTEELAEQLTMAGLEVDHVEPAAAAFSRVVAGRILDLTSHPNSERLRVCRVDVGDAAPHQIVCGASNAATGLCAPVALVGAVLPDGRQIGITEVRGVRSQGMLCSAEELGLAEASSGLLALPSDTAPGLDIRDFLGLDDQVIEVDLTPNRGDCLGLNGIAREVGVLNRCDVTPVAIHPVEPLSDATFPVSLSSPTDCPRYVGRVIRGVNPAAETPLWMRERLRRADIRSLGPLVDVANYVMLELGQPMHAFDLSRLRGGIDVRRASPGERLLLLNGDTVDLDGDTLVIADDEHALAMAGVMGGEDSAVGVATRDVFLESAFFAPLAIVGRARRYGLHTDSSHRFERGVDPGLQRPAMERATRLLLEIAGGQAGPVIEAAVEAHLPQRSAIRLRRERIQRLLGLNIEDADVTDILQRLGMSVTKETEHWLVVPPSFRFDVTIEADLIEEIGRIYGYNRLPSDLPISRLTIAPQPEAHVSAASIRQTLVQRGFYEAIAYSFVDPRFQQLLDPERDPIPLANPISSDLAVMRTTLWPGLLKALLHNQKRQQPRVRLFEYGLTFVRDGERLDQLPHVAAVACGAGLPEQWATPTRPTDLFDLKSDVEALLALTGEESAFRFVATKHPALHPGQSARILRDGAAVGWIGAVHPAVIRQLDLEGDVFVFEVSAQGIGTARIPNFVELSKYPAIRRDIAVVTEEGVSAESVRDCIRAHATKLLREICLFDVYRGKGVSDGHKSMAFGLILQDFSSTLTDSTVEDEISRIVSGLEQKLGATLRV